MSMSPFHAMYTARRLAEYGRGAARLIPAYASSDIEVYPYQIAAAMFALRSPYLGGAVLADEGSLGKTYESLLIISELYFEGRDRIMDLYRLITFIDDTALGDAEDFYKRYFRKPENYSELTAIASRYCFRTLRTQAESYTKIPRRIPVTASYSLSVKELKLAALMEDYLQKPDKLAFPKMDSYDLTLLFSRALASSPFALAGLADRANGRVKESELLEMATLAADIRPQSTGKGREMLKALKRAFAELKKRGVNQKAIIFTGSLSTIGFLHELLSDKYKTLAFDGSKSSDYSVIKRFESEAEILITTDVAAEGFHLAFCSFVVNYDLPYNVLTPEQRIMRCHRQGQQNDVIVLNFLGKDNFADVRMLELINKRVLQFDGIMGMSDDVVGNFVDNALDGIIAAFEMARHKKEIEAAYQATLKTYEDTNTALVREAENTLFTTFTYEVADKVTVTPQYVKDRTDELNAMLWELTKWFCDG